MSSHTFCTYWTCRFFPLICWCDTAMLGNNTSFFCFLAPRWFVELWFFQWWVCCVTWTRHKCPYSWSPEAQVYYLGEWWTLEYDSTSRCHLNVPGPRGEKVLDGEKWLNNLTLFGTFVRGLGYELKMFILSKFLHLPNSWSK